MKELFTNLATNAIKYNRPGGQVWITVGEQGDDMLVRVKDNGVNPEGEPGPHFRAVLPGG